MEDVNDNPPAFTSFPIRKTVNVRNDKKIGSEIAKVKAADADGTQPGNIVKYKVEARSNKAADYFGIDPNTGVITLLGDLTMEVYDEYKLEVLAHDMGKKNLGGRNMVGKWEPLLTCLKNSSKNKVKVS